MNQLSEDHSRNEGLGSDGNIPPDTEPSCEPQLPVSIEAGTVHNLKNCILAIQVGLDRFKNLVDSGGTILPADIVPLESAIQHCAELSGQILAKTAGGSEPSRLIDVGRTLKESMPLFKLVMLGRHSLDLVLPVSPVLVRASSTQIQQIICNLLINSRDSIRGRGHVRIELDSAHGSDGTSTGCLTVSDDAGGIAPENPVQFFQPGFTTKSHGAGRCLGLSNVKALAEGFGGSVESTSEVGGGTRVAIRFPVHRAEGTRC